MPDNTKPPHAAEVAALVDGLDRLKAKVKTRNYKPALRVRDKLPTETTMRTQFRMTEGERHMLKTLATAAHFAVGRKIAPSLILRLGMQLATEAFMEALQDREAAKKLAAKVMAVRSDRHTETDEAATAIKLAQRESQ